MICTATGVTSQATSIQGSVPSLIEATAQGAAGVPGSPAAAVDVTFQQLFQAAGDTLLQATAKAATSVTPAIAGIAGCPSVSVLSDSPSVAGSSVLKASAPTQLATDSPVEDAPSPIPGVPVTAGPAPVASADANAAAKLQPESSADSKLESPDVPSEAEPREKLSGRTHPDHVHARRGEVRHATTSHAAFTTADPVSGLPSATDPSATDPSANLQASVVPVLGSQAWVATRVAAAGPASSADGKGIQASAGPHNTLTVPTPRVSIPDAADEDAIAVPTTTLAGQQTRTNTRDSDSDRHGEAVPAAALAAESSLKTHGPSHAQLTPVAEQAVTFRSSFLGQEVTHQDSMPRTIEAMDTGADAPAVSTSGSTAKHLEVSLRDLALGDISVRAEMKDGVVHASVIGNHAGSALTASALHQFLEGSQVAVHKVHVETSVSSGGARTVSTFRADADSSGAAAEQHASSRDERARQKWAGRQDPAPAEQDAGRTVHASTSLVPHTQQGRGQTLSVRI